MIDPSPFLLALCCWREARGEPLEAKQAQAWSVRNRVMNPKWWGTSWFSVILKPLQYSSFNASDKNATRFPAESDASWLECLVVAEQVYAGALPDPTGGAVSYYDKSLDGNPPTWAARMTPTVDVGNFHFFKEAV